MGVSSETLVVSGAAAQKLAYRLSPAKPATKAVIPGHQLGIALKLRALLQTALLNSVESRGMCSQLSHHVSGAEKLHQDIYGAGVCPGLSSTEQH